MPSKFLFLAVAAALLPFGSIDATADSRRMTVLRPPVTPACISSSFGPRILPNQPEATVMRIQSKGPGGLEMLVQHDSFVGIYSHFGTIMPAFTEGKRTVAAGEKLGVVGRTGVTSGAHLYFEMLLAGKPVDPAPYLGVPPCSGAVRRTAPGRPDVDGVMIGGRRYWQIDIPSQQYIQWHQN
jgi:hypothetical protein